MDEEVGKKAGRAHPRSKCAGQPRLRPPPVNAGETTEENEEEGEGSGTNQVLNFRSYLDKEFSEAFGAILMELIVQAKLGSITHTKLLFELAGIKQRPGERGKRKRVGGASLSQMLLKEIERLRLETNANVC